MLPVCGSDKCKKGGFDSLFGMFVPIFGDLGAFLRRILLHVGTFRQMLGLWGSLEASCGGMLGGDCYAEGFATVILLFCGKKP